MKKIMVIGFQPYNEEMYPHTFEVLKFLESHCSLTYIGCDDRGQSLYKIGIIKWRPLTLWNALRKYRVQVQTSRRIKNIIKSALKSSYDAVIAIDHAALHYCCLYARNNSAVILWSHDFFSPDHPWTVSPAIRKLVKQNRAEVARCSAIIIQDINRGIVLDSILPSSKIPKIYLPVSIADDDYCRLAAEKRKTSLPKDYIKVMQLGTIYWNRYSNAILDAYQNMSERVEIIFKGFIDESIQTKAAKSARKPLISGIEPSLRKMRESVDGTDIGIIACRQKNLNILFFSRASGQLVEFLHLGIPVIVLDMSELGEFVEQNGCGVSISSVSQIEQAAFAIAGAYATYSEKAYAVFKKHFNIALHTGQFLSLIES